MLTDPVLHESSNSDCFADSQLPNVGIEEREVDWAMFVNELVYLDRYRDVASRLGEADATLESANSSITTLPTGCLKNSQV